MPPPSDDGLVARMYADRQNKYNPALHGPPQPIPETLRAESGVSAGNIVDVPPQDPTELTTPAPVVDSGVPPQGPAEQVAPMTVALSARGTLQVKGAGATTLQVAPRDEFAE